MSMADLILRTAVPDKDYPALAMLLSKIWDEPTTAADIHDWDQIGVGGGDGRFLTRILLENEQKELLGYGTLRHQTYEEEGWFYIWVGVDPDFRCQGWGQLLYEKMAALAVANGASELGSDVLDNCPDCLRFAKKQGFNVDRQLYQATIDLHKFEAHKFTGIIETVEAAGIRFTSLAAEGDTEAARRKLHALNYQVALDDPASNGSFPAFAAFNNNWKRASWFVPEGQLLAVVGDQYVGLSAVGYMQATNSMVNLMTGVDKAYRGRKIAQALKLKSIEFAQTYGADYILTHNDSQNAPILAINRKLGYRPKTGEYRLKMRI